MVTMHLGVTDIPYSWGQKKAGGISAAKAIAAAKKHAAAGTLGPAYINSTGVTTGDVAEKLEASYALMQTFLRLREREINATVENSVLGALESALMGKRPGQGTALASATSAMEDLFKTALSQRAFDGQIHGVPTAASLHGASRRFKRAYMRRPSRPSFIDTGLFQSSFRVWTT
jgi:hypothetical protein